MLYVSRPVADIKNHSLYEQSLVLLSMPKESLIGLGSVEIQL